MINVKNLSIYLRNFQLDNINLKVDDGKFFVLIGPTGSGKSLILESISGIRKIDRGNIVVDNYDITYMKPEKRNISICYQDCSLFPHMTCKENILYGLKFRKDKRDRKYKERLNKLTKFFKLENILNRYPKFLSGGEKQRVALARALIIDPKILLLDEPFSALDNEIKQSIQRELKQIHKVLKNTIIMVTHSLSEAYFLADEIGIIRDGQILQQGKITEVFKNPKTEFIAKFIGMKNLIPKKIDGKTVHIGIRPENIIVTHKETDREIQLEGIVSGVRDCGIYMEIDIKSENLHYISYMTINACFELNLFIGDKVYFGFNYRDQCIISGGDKDDKNSNFDY